MHKLHVAAENFGHFRRNQHRQVKLLLEGQLHICASTSSVEVATEVS